LQDVDRSTKQGKRINSTADPWCVRCKALQKLKSFCNVLRWQMQSSFAAIKTFLQLKKAANVLCIYFERRRASEYSAAD
jgi:hypothetical protein